MKLEEKLVQLRKENGLSQMYVAESLGVSRQAISRWEVGSALPSTDNLRKLAELYGVSVDALLNETAEITVKQAQRQVEEVSLPKEDAPKGTACKSTGEKIGYIVLAAAAAVLTFLGGYMTGYAQAEKKQDEPIPFNELETMFLDLSGAERSTFGWDDFEEGGE